MRSRQAWARGRLHRMLERMKANPFSDDEVVALREQLEALEVQLEALGERARLERADVERLEVPWRRALLWLVGRLATDELRERREYEEALATVLREGERAARLRAQLDALGPPPAYTDAQVAEVLRAVNPADFRRYGVLGRGLAEIREGLDFADDVWWTDRFAGRLYQVVKKGRKRSSVVGRFQKLARSLRKLGLVELEREVATVGALFESDGPSQSKYRTQRARTVLMQVRTALRDERKRRLEGIARAVEERVKDVELPSWP